MLFDLSKYKVVYRDKVLRALCILDIFFAPFSLHGDKIEEIEIEKQKPVKPEALTILFFDDDNTISAITGTANEFQFIPILSL